MDLDALLDAADHGRLDDLRAGLASGLDVNAVDPGGWTALLTATRAVQRGAVGLLLDAGADVHAQRPGGFGALHLLIQAAQEAMTADHLHVAALLLDAGVDPNQPTDGKRQSPVRNAAALGLTELLQLLVNSGRADVNQRDKDKIAPLFAAADATSLPCVKVLLSAGADPNLADRFGRTPLHAAAAQGALPVARALLDAGADPALGTRFPEGRFPARTTASQVAQAFGHGDLVALLTAPPVPEPTSAPWPDADSEDAAWLRGVLKETVPFPMGRDSHHVLDAVLGFWGRQDHRDRLLRGFRGLLIDADPSLRAAACHFYVRKLVPDDGAPLRAWTEHLPLFSGVHSPWYPEDHDLRGLLAATLSRYAMGSELARAIVRAEALVRGRGRSVIAGLVAADRAWLLEHVVAVVDASPDALEVLLATARMRGFDPEAIMRRLIGTIDDDLLVTAIRAALPEWRDWLDAVVAQAAADASIDVEEPQDDYLTESRALLGQLLDHSAAEVFDKLELMLEASPGLGEALLLEMAARHMDLRGAVAALRDRVDRDTLKRWLRAAVDDELQLLVYMAMI